MTGYNISIEGDAEQNKLLTALHARGVPAGLHSRIGGAVSNVLKSHLQELDNSRANTLGGRRSHFYWNAAQSVKFDVTADGVELIVDKLGLRQRWLGGTIRAINGKYLTIPARSESYGVPAREFPQKLRFVKFRSGAAALVVDDQEEVFSESVDDAGNVSSRRRFKRNKRKKTGGLVQYWLKESVHQNPDPSVMPTEQEFADAATGAMREYFSEQ